MAELQRELLPVDGWGSFRRGARPAAVVAMLYRRDEAWFLPFVKRRAELRDHPGQVGLPGGTLRPDEEAWTAAAREVGEELGVSPAGLHPLGAGVPVYAAVTNFSVVPFVAWFEQPSPAFTPDARELEGILEIPVDRLLDDEAWELPGVPSGASGRVEPLVLGRYFTWEGSVVWGLTERLLFDLLPRFRRALAGTE